MNITSFFRMISTQRDTLNGFITRFKTQGKVWEWNLTYLTSLNLRVYIMMEWKYWFILREGMKKINKVGSEEVMTFLTSKTIIGESIWPTIRDATIHSHSHIGLNMIMIHYSLLMLNPIPILIFRMISQPLKSSI